MYRKNKNSLISNFMFELLLREINQPERLLKLQITDHLLYAKNYIQANISQLD